MASKPEIAFHDDELGAPRPQLGERGAHATRYRRIVTSTRVPNGREQTEGVAFAHVDVADGGEAAQLGAGW